MIDVKPYKPEEKKVPTGDEDKPELVEQAAKIGVTTAKLKAMREYAALLRRQDRRIKESTVRKKVCEKFKVKLV